EDGKYYYYEEGKLGEGAGLVKVGEDYYYITEDGTAVTDAKVDVEENELVDAGTYRFDETGKMIHTTEIVEEDGKYYYYEDGKLGEGAGLVKVGEDYYYITEDGTAVTDAKVDVEENELVDAGTYRFDETGKMINTTELVEEDGKLTYYENGKLGKDAGLIKYEDDYYYIGEDGTAVTNTQMLVEKTNGLLPEDTYCFGDDGKMFERLAGDADENGVVDLDDVTLIFEYCTDATIEINLINANVNGDTVVDAKDALLLMQYDAGWDIELQ
ncbi:MAG: dockerin type I repeat-containing protein, partial [Clostridia bacterium]|nr:dockerin type I repeat-containing protein [Clostridia bacterium]